MLGEYPVFQRGQAEEIYKDFEPKDKKFLEEYLKYRVARGLVSKGKLMDTRRLFIQIRYILGDDYKKLSLPIKKNNEPLKILRELIGLIKTSKLMGNTKRDLLDFVRNFLKYSYPDWSIRFDDFEDIKAGVVAKSEKVKQNSIVKEDVEKMMKHETKMFWKAFLITQYEGGLRTGEARYLKWSDIKFNVDGDISELSIYSPKTKKARTIFIKDATFYLQKLKDEQENLHEKKVYVFHSKMDLNKPVDKHVVSKWCRDLSQKALGRKIWNYLLRHARATELYNLADDNKIAEKTATRFMGHSKSMIKTYQNLDNNKVKEALKNQVYKLEDLPPEKKAELEKQIEDLKKKLSAVSDENLRKKVWEIFSEYQQKQKEMEKNPEKPLKFGSSLNKPDKKMIEKQQEAIRKYNKTAKELGY
jgi:integrase